MSEPDRARCPVCRSLNTDEHGGNEGVGSWRYCRECEAEWDTDRLVVEEPQPAPEPPPTIPGRIESHRFIIPADAAVVTAEVYVVGYMRADGTQHYGSGWVGDSPMTSVLGLLDCVHADLLATREADPQ